MKKAVLILGFLVISLGAFAQKRSDFQGPKYKNYKYWKHNNAPTVVYSTDKKKALTGPAYKNYKPWKDTSKVVRKKVIINGTNERQKLAGPKYKNYKPWLNKGK
ncbi:hypothetical protein [Aquimarina agarivorans]|uniref:hypothetical protein n=1 Tax=Aquimarina agarivorans TaxID=980584 RepID=UPI000248EBF0|nr:hypothetical protein [Aquimarina agarivorans]